MKPPFLLPLIALFALSALPCVLGQAAPALPDVVQRRNGLPNVFARLAAQKPLTIAAFGGSITEGAGASNAEKTSYRALLTAWFRARFPQSAITEVNAAIGGTGSTLGVFRLHNDVLSKKPDLVYVEYAVNDGGTPDAQIDRAMEGIVRQIRRELPQTDILFVYTLHSGMLADYKAGKQPITVVRHERIAAHYGIPSVNVGQVVAEQLNTGRITPADFSADGVHPKDASYQTYADTLAAFLTAEAARAPQRFRHTKLAPPLRPDSWQNAAIVAAAQAQFDSSHWQRDTKSFRSNLPQALVSSTPGAELTYRFYGDTVGLYYVLGPDTGILDYKLDSGDWQKFEPFDVFAISFARPSYRLLSDTLPLTDHVLTLRIRPEHDPRSKGNITRLIAFLVNSGK